MQHLPELRVIVKQLWRDGSSAFTANGKLEMEGWKRGSREGTEKGRKYGIKGNRELKIIMGDNWK